MKKLNHPTDQIINRIQDNVDESIQRIQRSPIIAGRVVQNVTIVSTQTTTVSHGLNRRPTGWFCVNMKTPNCNVYETRDSDSNFLYLRTSNDVTVSLWVF